MIWDDQGLEDLKTSEARVRAEVARLLPAESSFYQAWYSRDGRVAILLWGRNAPPIPPGDRVHRNQDGLRFFCGWLVDLERAEPINSVDAASLDSAGEFNGEFTACVAKAEGEVRFWRNLAGSMPLYYSSETSRFTLSSRASVAAYGRRLSTRFELSRDFARSVLTASIALNDHSLFDGVYSLPQGSVVFRPVDGRPVIGTAPADPFRNDALREQYLRDRSSYWDDAFEKLRALTAVFRATDMPLEVPLSGGKDSRLILGMLLAAGYRERIRNLLTWGTNGSPDMRSAGDVASVLGLSDLHRFRVSTSADAAAVVATRTRSESRYPRHVFLTEGEMSPMDLTGATPRAGISVSGQEGGLRNIAGKRYFNTSAELLHWFRVHLANWDVCGILTDVARSTSEQEFLDYFGRQLLAVDDFNQLPTKHRIEFRFRRWVARTWHVSNSTSFAPYLFPTDAVLQYTYNSGARSRSLEEFHFEMLRRADKRLLEVPFAEQTWDPDLAAVTSVPIPMVQPYTWVEGTKPLNRRPIGAKLQAWLDVIKQHVERRDPAVLEGVVDIRRLREFDAAEMKPGHVQPLMHLVNLLLADSVRSFRELDTTSAKVGSLEVPDFDSTPPD